MNPPKERWFRYFICVLLAAVTFAAFASVAGHSFIAFDDRDYVVGNSAIQHGFSWSSIKWAFTTFHSSNWHPLTWLSHMMDCRLFALDPSGPHLVNLAFHVANTVLLFLLLYHLTTKMWPAAFVAVLFGIHPMHVESVAWVSERKDVLSAFFFLLTLLAYVRYVELSRAKKTRCWMVYGLALVLFALGLLSKPMLVTLPGVLCLLDYWPLRRFEWRLKNQPKGLFRRLLVEKIPFIVLAALCCWMTFIAQQGGGTVKSDLDFTISQRLAHLSVAYGWYVLKFFWPVNLSVYYPLQTTSGDIFSMSLLVLALTGLVLWGARKYPWLFVGWWLFVGMLVPVIGLVQVGSQAYADRYTYLPYIGLSIMLAWGISELLVKWPPLNRQLMLTALTTLVVVVCFWRTVIELGYWKNGLVLFQRAVDLEPKNEMAWTLLGLEYEIAGNNDKAIEYEMRATALNNQLGLAWYYLGHMLSIKHDSAGAINAYQSALACPQLSDRRVDLYNDLGGLLQSTGQYEEAISAYQSSLELYPDQAGAEYQLAQCYVQNGQSDQAEAAFQGAIHLDPDYLDAHLNLAVLLAGNGREAEAIPHYRKVIELDTNIVVALNNLAWILATDADPRLRNGGEAVPLAEHACQRTKYQQAFFIGTLAAAYAEAGRYDDAAAAAQKAHDVALAHGQKEIADRNTQLMQLYKSGKPFHEDPQQAH